MRDPRRWAANRRINEKGSGSLRSGREPRRSRDHHRPLTCIRHDQGQEGGRAARPNTAATLPRACRPQCTWRIRVPARSWNAAPREHGNGEGLAPHPGPRGRDRRLPPHLPALRRPEAACDARVPERRATALPDLQHAHVAERDPAPMRFHDVRHTTATLLLKARVPIQHVQRILRHANIRTTVDTYGHLANEDLRAPLELLPAPTERALPSPIRPRHVPNMCQAARNPEKQGPGADSKSATAGPIFLERNTGFEPATFALARRRSTS